MKNAPSPKKGVTNRAGTAAAVASGHAFGVCLAMVDWYHRASLRAKQGERAVAPTKRITFSEELKRRVSANQGHRCMYCGVRLNADNRHIDHKIPVEHGGPNDETNLQATCNRCNSRKGIQTDEEFRERYHELLAGTQPGEPPTQRIDQRHFTAVTRRTRQLESTVARKKAVFKTPAQKIAVASAVAGAILAAVWFFAIALAFPGSPAAGTAALVGTPEAISLLGIRLSASRKHPPLRRISFLEIAGLTSSHGHCPDQATVPATACFWDRLHECVAAPVRTASFDIHL